MAKKIVRSSHFSFPWEKIYSQSHGEHQIQVHYKIATENIEQVEVEVHLCIKRFVSWT